MLLEVGHVVRAHGLRGEVVVELVTSLESRLAPGNSLSAGDHGRLVVSAARPLPGARSPRGGRWLVSFAGVSDRTASEALAGAVLRAEAPQGVEGLWVHELIGAEVVEVSGPSRGKIISVEANPASDLLVLDTGALVPLCFVVSSGGGKVVVDVPEGLFDL